jgi:DNA-binding NarL/FixJ family response regulator
MLARATDIKVVTVEDDDEFRGHLAALIGGANGFHCIGSYRSAEIALKHLPVEQPSVLLLDLELPNKQGDELIAEIAARWPKIAVLVLTIHDDPARIFPALEAGAVGYLVKPVAPVGLLDAITDAHAGGSPMSSQIARLVVKTFQVRGKLKQELEALTVREEEILNHVAKGFQSKEIADTLGISPRTVGTHLRNIYEKLQVRTRAQAVAKYLRQ